MWVRERVARGCGMSLRPLPASLDRA